MASAPSSWKTLFKFLLKNVFRRQHCRCHGAHQVWPRLKSIFPFRISFSRAHSELQEWSSEDCRLRPRVPLEGRKESWSPLESEGVVKAGHLSIHYP